jgi:hypothetical protein
MREAAAENAKIEPPSSFEEASRRHREHEDKRFQRKDAKAQREKAYLIQRGGGVEK